MKKYEKPNIVDEIIEIEDIISASPDDSYDIIGGAEEP